MLDIVADLLKLPGEQLTATFVTMIGGLLPLVLVAVRVRLRSCGVAD